MNTIYFDESGNTGPNLLDKSQTIYSLASHNYTLEETQELLSIIPFKGDEIHFVKVKRRYKESLLELFNHELISDSRIKYSVSHKKFELICRLVDNMMEPVFYGMGIDIYKGGHHVTTANVLYKLTHTTGISDELNKLLSFFQEMMRKRNNESISKFYEQNDSILGLNKFTHLFEIIKGSQEMAHQILGELNKYSIDPAYPAFIVLSNLWFQELKEKISVIHDESKQIEFWKEMIGFLSDTNLHQEKSIKNGVDVVTLPLQIKELGFSSSSDSKQLQLTDLIVSGLSFANNNLDNDFAKAIRESKLYKFRKNNITFPTDAITPEQLHESRTKSGKILENLSEMISSNESKHNQIKSRLK